jgi:hypothetical protein
MSLFKGNRKTITLCSSDPGNPATDGGEVEYEQEFEHSGFRMRWHCEPDILKQNERV